MNMYKPDYSKFNFNKSPVVFVAMKLYLSTEPPSLDVSPSSDQEQEVCSLYA